MARLLARFLLIWIAATIPVSTYSNDQAETLRVVDSDSGQSKSLFYGLSVGVGGGSFGFSSGLSLSLQKEHHLFSLRVIQSVETITIGPRPSEDVLEVGLLYGRLTGTEILNASFSGGVSFVGGVRRGGLKGVSGDDYERVKRHSVGFPVEINLAILPLPFLSIGLSFFGDLNVDQSIGGLLLKIQIGKLRSWGSIW